MTEIPFGIKATIDDKDRIIIPARVRSSLKIRKGAKLFLQTKDRGVDVFVKKPTDGIFLPVHVESQHRIVLAGVRDLFEKVVKIAQRDKGFRICPV